MTDQEAEATQAALNLSLGLTTASTLAVVEGTLNAFPVPAAGLPPTFKIYSVEANVFVSKQTSDASNNARSTSFTFCSSAVP